MSRSEAAARDRVAKRNGCAHVYANTPGTGYQSWFAGPNLGAPFDSALAARVAAELGGAK
jgi:hypothetical protein